MDWIMLSSSKENGGQCADDIGTGTCIGIGIGSSI